MTLTSISRLPSRVVFDQTKRQRYLDLAFAVATLRLAHERVVDTPHKRTYWTHQSLRVSSFRFRLTNRATPTRTRNLGPNEL